MIKDLDTSIVANGEAPVAREYGPLPKGTYELRLIEVGDWKQKTLRNVKVIAYDDRFQKIKDANGNDKITVVDSLAIYENNLKFEVVDGPYKGRWIFHRVNTHPNRPWEIPNMLAGFGVPSIKLSNISTLNGATVKAQVDVDSYMKKVIDDETGLENETKVEYNVVKRFNKSDIVDSDLDL